MDFEIIFHIVCLNSGEYMAYILSSGSCVSNRP